MPQQYTIEELGARIRQRQPGSFANFTDEQIGQRVFDRNPEKFKDIITTKPTQPQLPQELQPEKLGFFGGVKEDITGRAENFIKSAERLERGEQTLPETSLQVTGHAVGGLFDIFGRGLTSVGRGIGKTASALTPDVIEDPVKEKVKQAGLKLLQTKVGQAGLSALSGGVESYDKWKSENPRAAANLEAVVNIGSLFPARAIGKAGAKPVVKGAGSLAGTLEASAAKKTTKQLDDFVRDLISPVKTKKIKEAQVARTTEKGVGPFKGSIIEPTSQEAASIEAVLKIPGIKPGQTKQQSYNIISEANEKAAKTLKQQLEANDFDYNKDELLGRLTLAKENLKRNPAITGDAEKTADKLIKEIERRVNDADTTGSDLLQVRKDYDIWVKSQKGANVFDPNKENAFTLSNREIRRTINDFLDEKAVGTPVTESLAEQRALFNALENIRPKAAIEANNAFTRTLQLVSTKLATKSKVVQAIAAAVGIGRRWQCY